MAAPAAEEEGGRTAHTRPTAGPTDTRDAGTNHSTGPLSLSLSLSLSYRFTDETMPIDTFFRDKINTD